MKTKKTIFITGSTRGIGKAIAFKFARHNYTVILHGSKKTAESAETFKEITKYSKAARIVYFDVSQSQKVRLGCQEILKHHERIDVLVNNAGIKNDRTLLKMTYRQWDQVLKTNLYGPFLVTKHILPNMIKQNSGRIINIASVIGIIGNFGQSNYAASKAGLIGFTKSLAKETAKYNITVNAICPGLVNTDFLKHLGPQYKEMMLERIPLRRMATTDEIADLVYFLASHKSRYLTGEIINISGGWV
ncbi:hypothetical protein A2154_01710 [Candidatus Gottesmanbacteria bacterium RBG_16_43_7]|uniref:3-oxoacyl-[acyl-carrier-protein] reductase n=1 Tax=Candidatus Gottesmanbacteria bacterium RBG_16_43_7 TaxID=1798373 RepID=A0A1F5Z963_9BACT|nr:MAG: hypothetical protein A2154_01710 [Candidatus Gottesmanbacteria bacterium RBG_16_43_7]